MSRLGRDAPLPQEMQGKWVDVDEPTSEIEILGGEIICFGQVVDYDYKEIALEDGALTVSLKVSDPNREDAFQKANITELVISPEAEFYHTT